MNKKLIIRQDLKQQYVVASCIFNPLHIVTNHSIAKIKPPAKPPEGPNYWA
jgi:hypothetical protein